MQLNKRRKLQVCEFIIYHWKHSELVLVRWGHIYYVVLLPVSVLGHTETGLAGLALVMAEPRELWDSPMVARSYEMKSDRPWGSDTLLWSVISPVYIRVVNSSSQPTWYIGRSPSMGHQRTGWQVIHSYTPSVAYDQEDSMCLLCRVPTGGPATTVGFPYKWTAT